MKYVIESIEDERDVGLQIAQWIKNGKINLIEKGDKYEMIKAEVIKVQSALETLKKLGINRDVMETYIYSKAKVSKATLQDILYYQQEFLKKLKLM